MKPAVPIALASLLVPLASCTVNEVIVSSETKLDADGEDWWWPPDSWDPPYDPPRDDWWDPPPPDTREPDSGPCHSPPECLTAPPDHDRIGGPCISELDCGSGNNCYAERVEVFGGEVYVSWIGGTCAIIGTGTAGCNPDDPSTCPPGTTCLYLFNSGGEDYFGCLDACSATDTSWNAYDWNCGCREGYRCDINTEACLPGCSNDRECCEVWDDVDMDLTRSTDEVMTDDTCTNYCDGDDDDEYLDDECRAAWDCINFGDDEATYHSECLFDSDCPADATCLNEIYHRDPDTGEPLYPGGMCRKHRCELPGRGCEGPGGADIGGECVNVGRTDDPLYTCTATCTTGCHDVHSDLNPCRHPPGGHPYACNPYPPERWFPAGTNDGICLPATVPDPDPEPMYGPCSLESECASPLGLGTCFDPFERNGFCSAPCSEFHARECLICGAAPSHGAVPPGVCIGTCVPSCSGPHGDLGANGCPSGDMACYPNDGSYSGGSIADRDPDGADPTGFCLPACMSNDECTAFWSGATVCNTASGVCGI